MYKYFFDFIFYRVNFTYYRILNIMSGLTPAESDRRWDDLPMDLKKSFYEEMPGIAILSSFQLLNFITILLLGTWLIDYNNPENKKFAIIVGGLITFIYNLVRFKIVMPYMVLDKKWRNNFDKKRSFMTKIYCILSIIAFVVSVLFFYSKSDWFVLLHRLSGI